MAPSQTSPVMNPVQPGGAVAQPLRIALVNGPWLPNYSRGQRSPAVTRSGTLYYPMWLAYAAAHVERSGHEPLLVDAPAQGWDDCETISRIAAFRPDLVVVETATPSIEADLAFASRLKSEGVAPRVVVGGTHASALPEETLQGAPLLDAVLIGEYEVPLGELMAALASGRPWSGLEGVFLRGEPIRPRRRWFEDLDARPFVSEIYSRFLPIERYFNPNAHHPMVAIFTGRGCPHGCDFCVFPQTLTGRGYRRRSAESILDEFRWIAAHLPMVRGIFIEDDTFTADPERVKKFCGELCAARLSLSWSANARADLDEETLQAMKDAGLRALCVGFESGNQALLDGIGKGLSLARAETFAASARKLGVKVHGCFMVGLPGETRVTMQQTLQFALRLPLDSAQFYPLMVYPGTRAFDRAKREGNLAVSTYREWLTPEGLHRCVVRTPDLSPAQLSRFCNLARRRFYLRKSWLWTMLGRFLRDADERHRLIRSARTFLRHLLGDR